MSIANTAFILLLDSCWCCECNVTRWQQICNISFQASLKLTLMHNIYTMAQWNTHVISLSLCNKSSTAPIREVLFLQTDWCPQLRMATTARSETSLAEPPTSGGGVVGSVANPPFGGGGGRPFQGLRPLPSLAILQQGMHIMCYFSACTKIPVLAPIFLENCLILTWCLFYSKLC